MARKKTVELVGATSPEHGDFTVVMVEIDSIRVNPQNPNSHVKGVKNIAKSIERFGWQQPVVIDETGMILAGEGRYKAALMLKHTKIPCAVFRGTESQKRAFMVADNKVANFSSMMDDVLAGLMAQMDEDDLFSTGYSEKEIDNILAQYDDPGAKDDDDEEDGGFDPADLGAPGGKDEGSEKTASKLKDASFRIIVNCDDEKHQAGLIKALEKMGLKDQIEVQVL